MKYRKILIAVFVIVLIILYNVPKAKEKWQIINVEEGLPHRFIKCITSDGNLIWIGTANGVGIYDTSKHKIVKKLSMQKDNLLDNYITAIAIDKNLVWIATSKGISIYDKNRAKIIKHFTKKSGLSDNFITDIVVTENYVWASTKYWGVNRYDKATKRWRNFSVIHGLADNSVNCLALDGVLLWAGTKNGLSYYDEFTGMWLTFDVTQGLPHPNIRAIAVDGQYIWCGTTGGGLARFDKYDETFRVYTTTEGLADDFVQSLKLDGSYLWIGTFSGVTKYDKIKNKWITYTVDDGLSENSVSAIEIDGNYIWFGTDGGGVTRFDKEIPQAFLSPLSYYIKPGKIAIIGSAFDYKKIKSYKITFKTEGMKDWLSTGIKLTSTRNIRNSKLAEWDVKKLLNLTFDVKLEVINKNGKKNVSIIPLIIDTRPPELTLQAMPDAVKESPIFIKGTFIEDNLTRIIVQPDNIPAEVNRLARTYTAEVPLKRGLNNIKIIAYDIANQTSALERQIVYDTDTPEIVLDKYDATTGKSKIKLSGIVRDSSLKRIVLNPGNKEISFEKVKPGEYKFSYEVLLTSGVNKFQISAYDYVGNKVSVYPVIKYTATFPVVNVDKSIKKVNKPDFVIKGNWSDDNVDYILIEPPGKRAKLDLQRQTFSLKVKLKEGENVFTATIVDKDNNKSIDVVSVVFTTTKSFIQLVDMPEFTFDKKLLVKGKYSEPNLKKILLMPGKKKAMIDYNNETFTLELADLKYGENRFKIEMYDKFGTKTEKSFSIVFDNKSPEISIKDLPEVVNTPEITIKGKFKEDYIDKIIVQPGDITAKIDKKNNSFKLKMLLNEGKNRVKFIAYDKAGNRTEIARTVTLVPRVATSVEEITVDSEYVKKLKAEIARLKALLKQREGIQVKKRVPVFVPRESAFYFVPYKPEMGFSLMEIAKKYLGNPFYIDFITRVNSVPYIKRRKKVLLPSKSLIRTYKKIKSERYRNIIDIIGLSYNLSKGRIKDFRKKLSYYLSKKGLIPADKLKFYKNRNIINLGDYLIAINTSKYAKYLSSKKVVALSFKPAYLKVKVISSRLMSNAKR